MNEKADWRHDHPILSDHPSAVKDSDIYALSFTVERHWMGYVKGRMIINDLLTISYDDVDDTYMVYNPDGSTEWTSVHKDKNIAIMLYLHKRLGITGKVEESHASQR